MAQQLYMIGLTVQDMEKSQEFYRRLGVAIPEGKQQRPAVMVKMGEEFTFFLAPRSIESEKSASGEAPENYRVLFEYYLKSQAAVEAKYAELIGYGYQSYRAPFIYTNGMCFAFVNDPDGNTILLSGDVEGAGVTAADEP
jgi:predicted lactoylglutathione lyase